MSLSNSQYNAIMRIYNQRQFQNKYEQDQRVKEVYGRIPQIRQIEDAMSTQKAFGRGRESQAEAEKSAGGFKGAKGGAS